MSPYSLSRQDTLLLVIDVQERVNRVMEYGKQVIRNTLLLARAAETFGIPVVLTEHYPQGLGHTEPELLEGIREPKVVEKIFFSAWESPLRDVLSSLGRRQVVVTGMETHVCVFQTVRDLLANGFQVQIVEDAVCSRRKLNWENGLRLMEGLGAVRTNAETAVFDLLQRAATPEFRALLPWIR